MLVSAKYALSVATGIGLWYSVGHTVPHLEAAALKLSGTASECPWKQIVALPASAARFAAIRSEVAARTSVKETDEKLGIVRVETPLRPFWIAVSGTEMKGPELLAYLITEQRWVAESNSAELVHPGDVVVDVGAHVGTFTAWSLQRGASKVVLFEPDPVNVECLRRNFVNEIADGRVILFPEGAWSSELSIDLNLGVANSGTGSMVYKEAGGRTIKVRVRPIDVMLKEAGVDKVNFIKMDIEGAEREAIKGAAATIRAHRPRMMLDSYHLPDDATVLPKLLTTLHPAYQEVCGPCEFNDNHGKRIAPHVTFYH